MLKHICIVFLAMCFCFSQTGQAKNYNQNVHLVTVSWYKQLGKTASGEMNNPHALTVAHKSLPFGTIVMFINPNNKKIVFARVTDRGPYIHNREYDISQRCAEILDVKKQGVAKLLVEVVRIVK